MKVEKDIQKYNRQRTLRTMDINIDKTVKTTVMKDAGAFVNPNGIGK